VFNNCAFKMFMRL